MQMSKCANETLKKAVALLLITVLCTLIASAQKVIKVEKASDHSTYIKGSNFEGVIFDKEYKFPYNVIDSTYQRFTPTVEEIELVEKALKQQIKELNKNHPNQISRKSNIEKHLGKYRRQYFGIITPKGERTIHVNCFKKEKDDDWQKSWMSNLYEVLDGGSNYWRVNFNIATGVLFDFSTNGVA